MMRDWARPEGADMLHSIFSWYADAKQELGAAEEGRPAAAG